MFFLFQVAPAPKGQKTCGSGTPALIIREGFKNKVDFFRGRGHVSLRGGGVDGPAQDMKIGNALVKVKKVKLQKFL